jgi:hypothetical protein
VDGYFGEGNNLYDNDQTKEIMELSERSELLLLKKDKNRWVLKDKIKLLKEIDIVKNRKVREFTSSISKLGKNSPNINLMKDTNNKMISDIKVIFDMATLQKEQGLANFLADRQDKHQFWGWWLRSSLKQTIN